MARAWKVRDRTGALCISAEGTIEGKRRQRRVQVPDADEALADAIVEQLNQRFRFGDLGWLAEGRRITGQTNRRRWRKRTTPLTIAEWSERWLQMIRPPEIAESTWRNYRFHANDICTRFGSRRLDDLDVADILFLQRSLRSQGRAEPTIRDRLGVLRMMLRDARLHGLVSSSPFDTPLPTRKTKRQRQQQRARTVTFRPLTAEEIEKLLEVLRSPRNSTEHLYFPLTELLVLTGLRYGEGAALRWTDVSFGGRRIHIHHAISRHGRGEREATKTAAEWSIPLRTPLGALLERQRSMTYVGRPEGWVFPSGNGKPLGYHNWRRRGWTRALQRAGVQPRDGDSQKALRRSFITSGLICGRNPKEIASEIGHASMRMLITVYDSFLDSSAWPDPSEVARLKTIYGWSEPSSVPENSLSGSRGLPIQNAPPS